MIFPGVTVAAKFLVTRPIIIPLAVLSSGLVYGTYDLSKLFGRTLFRKDATEEGWISRSVGWVSGTGTLSTMMMMSPHKKAQKEMWKEISVRSMRTAGSLLKFNAGALFMSGVVGGLCAAYSLPDKKR